MDKEEVRGMVAATGGNWKPMHLSLKFPLPAYQVSVSERDTDGGEQENLFTDLLDQREI